MALNSSGPLSLGGATVGQSINLELGQAATATASINATNFRTLAGVASGQISISNFYGKSSSTAFILYLGAAGTSLTSVTINNSWRVNNLGVMAFNTGNSSRVQYINNTGTTLITSKDYANGNYSNAIIYCPLDNKLPSTTDYFVALQNSFYGVAYSSSNSYDASIINRAYAGQNSANTTSAVGHPDGSMSYAGDNDQGKYGWRPVFWKATPSGPTFLLGTRSISHYRQGTSTFAKLLLRTDGSFNYINDTGGNCEIYSLNSSFDDAGGAKNIYIGPRVIGGAALDTSNNMYVFTSASVFKLTASLTSVLEYTYSTINPAFNTSNTYTNWGMDIYNNILYIAAGGSNGNSLTILAITASTMAVLWTKRWEFQAPNLALRAASSSVYGGAIQARPTGLYVAFQAFTTYTSTGGYIYAMCLPLDGNIANQTVTINGTSQQVTITSPTTFVGTSTFSVGGLASPGSAQIGGSLNANLQTIAAAALPTLTKTSF